MRLSVACVQSRQSNSLSQLSIGSFFPYLIGSSRLTSVSVRAPGCDD